MPRTGIEPVTRGFSVLCSTDWAIWAQKIFFQHVIKRARDRNRTGTGVTPQDFKSCASASSATRAGWLGKDSDLRSYRNRFTVCPLWPLGNPTILYKADERTRTVNLLITSQLLCQLSHIGIWIRQPLTFPGSLPPSIISRLGLTYFPGQSPTKYHQPFRS